MTNNDEGSKSRKAAWWKQITAAHVMTVMAGFGLSTTSIVTGVYAWGKSTTQAWAQTKIDQAIKASPAITDIQKTVDSLQTEQKKIRDDAAETNSAVTIIKEQNKIIIELLKDDK